MVESTWGLIVEETEQLLKLLVNEKEQKVVKDIRIQSIISKCNMNGLGNYVEIINSSL